MDTNNTTQDLKNQLLGIDFYQRFPMMIPFIGDYYISDNHKKMLLVGESFYFPKNSKIHLDAGKWYQASEKDLCVVEGENGEKEDEKEWINCKNLLENKKWNKGHSMYINLNNSIKTTNLDFKARPIDEVAFTNFFVRPAKKGKSIKEYEATSDIEIDKQKANKVLESVLQILKPDVLIFVSKYAFECVDKNIWGNFENMKVDFFSHPCSTCWNCYNSPRGKINFQVFLEKYFVQT